MEMRAVYAECLAKIMEEDKHVVVLDADLAKASGTRKLYEQFPEQMFDCGVAEQDMASIAAGLSSYGFKPWIESFTPFATRRICDQIAISISYAKQNVKIVGTDPGISAELNGGTHMSMEDIGVVRSIPGVVIFEPVDETQLRNHNDYYLQAILYARIVRSRQQQPVAPALLFIQHAAAEDFNPILKFGSEYISDVATTDGDRFVQLLMQKVNEIFDPALPLTPTADTERCCNCPYAHLCGL